MQHLNGGKQDYYWFHELSWKGWKQGQRESINCTFIKLCLQPNKLESSRVWWEVIVSLFVHVCVCHWMQGCPAHLHTNTIFQPLSSSPCPCTLSLSILLFLCSLHPPWEQMRELIEMGLAQPLSHNNGQALHLMDSTYLDCLIACSLPPDIQNNIFFLICHFYNNKKYIML